jgi:DNA-binding CsgD family transcriptional regulator
MGTRDPRREDQVRALIEAGHGVGAIAERMGLSPSVVSRTALRLGYRSGHGPPRKYDWDAIRAYYDEGHSARECRERFGFTAGAWDSAVSRGEIVPRAQRDPAKHSHTTRKTVARLLSRGVSQAEIARELALSKGTVAFHVRSLGISPDKRFSRRYDWSAVQAAIDEGLSMRDCMERFGFSRDAWGKAVKRGDIVPGEWITPLGELLVAGRRRSRGHVKSRLLRAGLKEDRCERCGLSEWQGKRINMHLHHINGDGVDNRLENLELLCPNCHSQTDTYGGRNGHRRRVVH